MKYNIKYISVLISLFTTYIILLGYLMYNVNNIDNEMTVTKELFGYFDDNREVYLFTMSNVNGLEIKITNYGGIITSLKAPDKKNKFDNVVLGYNNLQDYLDWHPYFGAIIGRFANRIVYGKFELDGIEYQLATNAGEHHIHGGERGFDKVLWDAKIVNDRSLRLTYLSLDGEEGYPGNLDVTVTYTLTDDDELKIEYLATTDKATPINLTSHSYFNLSGDFSKSILGHQLKMHASKYTPVIDPHIPTFIPTGELESVEGTPWDFSEFTEIGARIDLIKGGYDHNYVLDGPPEELKIAAELYDPESGRKLDIYTTEPGVQLYTGNNLDGQQVSDDGIPFKKYAGLCLEPEHFPNSPNEPGFPSTILRPGEIYRSKTVFSFSVE